MKSAADKKEMLRNRKGRYVAECEHCGCPEGCACSPEEPWTQKLSEEEDGRRIGLLDLYHWT